MSNDVLVDQTSVVKPKRGRPRKADIEAKKKPGKIGRPVGDNGRIAEFKARLLSTTGSKVIDMVLHKALDPNDKDQVACLKMCMDRLLPLSMFDKNASGQRNAVTINITGIGEAQVEAAEIIDNEVEITDVDYDEA